MEFYNQTVLDLLKKPKNAGEVKNPDGCGEVGNPACGDVMRISIKVKKGRIKQAKFKTFGCAAAIASSSMVTELALGKTLEEALALTKEEIIAKLGGLPPVKIHCSLLGLEALKKAIENFQKKAP